MVSSTIPQIALSTFGDSAAVHALISGTNGVPVANAAIQIMVVSDRDITVTSLTWFSTAQSGNYDIRFGGGLNGDGAVDEGGNCVARARDHR